MGVLRIDILTLFLDFILVHFPVYFIHDRPKAILLRFSAFITVSEGVKTDFVKEVGNIAPRRIQVIHKKTRHSLLNELLHVPSVQVKSPKVSHASLVTRIPSKRDLPN